jgi:hypothetical protein
LDLSVGATRHVFSRVSFGSPRRSEELRGRVRA